MYGGRLLKRCTAGTAECTIARPSSASHTALICAATSSPALWLFLLRRTLRSRCIAYTANLQARCASSLYSIRPNLGRERDAHTRSILLRAVRVPTMPSASLLRGCLLGLSSSGSQCDLRCLACRTVPLRRRFGRPRDCDDAELRGHARACRLAANHNSIYLGQSRSHATHGVVAPCTPHATARLVLVTRVGANMDERAFCRWEPRPTRTSSHPMPQDQTQMLPCRAVPRHAVPAGSRCSS
jgi:hypothetical protein